MHFFGLLDQWINDELGDVDAAFFSCKIQLLKPSSALLLHLQWHVGLLALKQQTFAIEA